MPLTRYAYKANTNADDFSATALTISTTEGNLPPVTETAWGSASFDASNFAIKWAYCINKAGLIWNGHPVIAFTEGDGSLRIIIVHDGSQSLKIISGPVAWDSYSGWSRNLVEAAPLALAAGITIPAVGKMLALATSIR